MKTASEMTYTVSGGALNSAQPQPQPHVEYANSVWNPYKKGDEERIVKFREELLN